MLAGAQLVEPVLLRSSKAIAITREKLLELTVR
jgi:hypothetical protein